MFLGGALLEAFAALAVADFWGKRRVRYSGQGVVLGVVVAAATGLTLLVLQWEGGYRHGLFWLWVALVVWCCWAVWELTRQEAWQGVPHPRRFAVGVGLSAVVGAASVAYSSMYSPYVAPPNVPFSVSFGKPTLNSAHTSVYVPVRLAFRNDGPISIHVVGTLWSATLWPSAFAPQGTDFGTWKTELGDGWDTYRHEKWQGTSSVLAAGAITDPGARLDPGDDFSKNVVVEVPLKNGGDGRVEISAATSFIRADRGHQPQGAGGHARGGRRLARGERPDLGQQPGHVAAERAVGVEGLPLPPKPGPYQRGVDLFVVTDETGPGSRPPADTTPRGGRAGAFRRAGA